jgi:hypothetical protein
MPLARRRLHGWGKVGKMSGTFLRTGAALLQGIALKERIEAEGLSKANAATLFGATLPHTRSAGFNSGSAAVQSALIHLKFCRRCDARH